MADPKKPPAQPPERKQTSAESSRRAGAPARGRDSAPVVSSDFVEAEDTHRGPNPFGESAPVHGFDEEGPRTELDASVPLLSALEEETPKHPLPAAGRPPARPGMLRASPVKERHTAAREPSTQSPPKEREAPAAASAEPRKLRLPLPGEVMAEPEGGRPLVAAPPRAPRPPPREDRPPEAPRPRPEGAPPGPRAEAQRAAAKAPSPTPTRAVLAVMSVLVVGVAVAFGVLARKPVAVVIDVPARQEQVNELPPAPPSSGPLSWFRVGKESKEEVASLTQRPGPAPGQVQRGAVPVRRQRGPRTMWMRLPDEKPRYGFEPVEDRPPARSYDSENWPTGQEPSRLVIFTDPPGVRVTVDGAIWGVTPMMRGVPQDWKRMKVTLGGGIYPEKTVDLSRGKNNQFELGMKMEIRPRPLPPPPPEGGPKPPPTSGPATHPPEE